jgi:hypothetical protein
MSTVSSIDWRLRIPRYARGIFYREWLALRNIVVGFWAAWFVCLPVLMIFDRPAWILAFGVLYAIFAGPEFGGMDAAEGSEEFAFSLPATRKEIFLTRLVLGGGNLLAMLVLSLLCIRLNLPQMLWGIFVESGFTERFPPVSQEWYWAAFCMPPAVYATSYVMAALTRSRRMVGASGFVSVNFVGAVFGLIVLAEKSSGFVAVERNAAGNLLMTTNANLIIPNIIVLALSSGVLAVGYHLYLRKEGISRPAAVRGGISWWVRVLIGLGILLFLSILANIAYMWTTVDFRDVPL